MSRAARAMRGDVDTTNAVIVEIRAGEGGDDAKDLVLEQYGIYERLCVRRGL